MQIGGIVWAWPHAIIYAALAVATIFFARWLYLRDDRTDRRRGTNPDNTWKLVVLGDALIAVAFALVALLAPQPHAWGDVVQLVTTMETAGIPMIVGERARKAKRERQEAQRRNGDADGPTQ